MYIMKNSSRRVFNPLSANVTKWSNTLKKLTGKPSLFDDFAGMVLKGLRPYQASIMKSFSEIVNK